MLNFLFDGNLFDDNIPEEWAISMYTSDSTLKNNLHTFITRFEESKQPPPREEDELPLPPAMFQEQLSPPPFATAVAASVSSPSQPARSASNQHHAPPTAEQFSQQMEIRTYANSFDSQNDSQNDYDDNINNQCTVDSDEEEEEDSDFCVTELFPPTTAQQLSTRGNHPTINDGVFHPEHDNKYTRNSHDHCNPDKCFQLR